jgi:hypothetical protein
MTSLSEIGKIRQSIQSEIESSRRGLQGLASVARHEVINKRMGRLDELHSQLASHIGQDEATRFILKTEAIILDRQDANASKYQQQGKPTLMQVRRDKGLQSSQLASAANLPLRIEYQAEIGVLVDKEIAERILYALSCLTDEKYTLDNVVINIKSEVKS